MIEAELPQNEAQRLEALLCLGLLDSATEQRFDHIVALAKELFDVPIALISLVDEDRQWFKAKSGIQLAETSRDISFCSHILHSGKVLVVENALEDERFYDNPLVNGSLSLRFYAGHPIHSPEGYVLGSLCLIDHVPRDFTKKDRTLLRHLADMVDKEIVSRPITSKSLTSAKEGKCSELFQRVSNLLSLKPVAIAFAATIFFAVLILGSRSQLVTLETKHLEKQAEIADQLFNVRGRLETELNSRLHLTHGLAGFVRAGPQNIDRDTFHSFATVLGKSISGIRSLQLAPGGVVDFLWPEATNSPALGHNLLKDPKRREVAQKSIDMRELWIAGPLQLIQGGIALIGRLPVFLPSQEAELGDRESFWGFATVLIDLDTLLSISEFHEVSTNLNIAIRGRNGLGSEGETFVGSEAVFNGAYQSATISMPAGSWELGVAVPSAPTFRNISGGTWLSLICGALALAAFIYALMRLPFRYLQAVDTARQALANSNARFKDAIEALPDGFAVYDDDDRLVRFNKRYREFFSQEKLPLSLGLTFEQILDITINSGVYQLPDESKAARDAFREMRVSHHSNPSRDGLELALSNGRWLRAVESRVPSGGTVIAYTDVSELKKKEHEIASEKLRAESANDAKTAFLATVSHELRTPLNAILGMLNLLQLSGRLQPQDQEHIDVTHDSAEHLLNLLNELLDLSKMEANKLELECNDFNLAAIARKTLKLSGSKAKQKDIDLVENFASEANIMVRGDAGRLQQILLNLLSNGIKFTDIGSVTLALSGEKVSSGKILFCFRIDDTGIGFAPDQASALFKPFSQLDSTASRKHEGTGLGLVICKRLVELMGGTITAHGEIGNGASFELRIPFQVSEVSEKHEQIEDSLVSTPAELSHPPIRVLIAEDSPANQIVFRAMLQNTGYYADVAGNGLEAVQAAENFEYDIILMDIFMPEMDGIEATNKIRRSDKAGRVPIIALTANAMPGDRDKFLESGMDDYLAKPLNKNTLIKMLNKWGLRTHRE
ncbi:response regulator [Marinobacter litoralis]|uniref:response regulator n=1 Tax=Marinobacter litoralis TaxID=187981 RepID=UPI0018EB628C|nr:response regulator [Marinobacter litoralis]MBJ6138930.1 response regulator [Marinobacter litoralis]